MISFFRSFRFAALIALICSMALVDGRILLGAESLEIKPEVVPKLKETESTIHEFEHKLKELEHEAEDSEAKPKDMESHQKEVERVADERPCPQVNPSADNKPAENGQSSTDQTSTDKTKFEEAEGKKSIHSLIITAKLALMADSRLFPYDIEIDAKGKDLVLLGKVTSDSEKQTAADIIRCLDGVHAVENRLKVNPNASHELVVERDKIITQLIKERFEKSGTLQAVKFDVKTEGGVVTLTGSTRYQVIILEAAQAARQVPGVKAVNTGTVRLITAE
ncbi:hyperosmotically inducible protein [Nitrosomonas communis]|uniref:Hyperosmotically inducible protein n=2 Tax=Nitrosomonas communis TaxID=44574 RepID=A0A1I4V6X5_9PROT|nr:hyperosmotically inducible protein [Nitrosomonas communis]